MVTSEQDAIELTESMFPDKTKRLPWAIWVSSEVLEPLVADAVRTAVPVLVLVSLELAVEPVSKKQVALVAMVAPYHRAVSLVLSAKSSVSSVVRAASEQTAAESVVLVDSAARDVRVESEASVATAEVVPAVVATQVPLATAVLLAQEAVVRQEPEVVSALRVAWVSPVLVAAVEA